jgi:hypothetical protein
MESRKFLEWRRISETSLMLVRDPSIASSSDLALWGAIRREVLSHAFGDRTACLITVDPQPRSLGRELSDAPPRVIDGRRYLVHFVASCSDQLLADVAASEDFERGLLWLTSIGPADEDRVRQLVRAISSAGVGVPVTLEELVMCVDDDRMLWWLNSTRPNNDVLTNVRRLANDGGWTFNDAAPEPLT